MRNYLATDPDTTAAGNALENVAKAIPTDFFLWLAGGSILTSLTLKILGRDHEALFVGQWAPTFLIIGVYNKFVRREEH